MAARASLAMYWNAGCGGCEISVVNLHEALLDVLSTVNLVFCPCLVDTKYQDLAAMPDDAIDVTLLNGSIRTEDNVAMARLLRRTSKVLVAYGTCAMAGSIPGLGNLSTTEQLLQTVYTDQPSLDNPNRVLPRQRTPIRHGELTLPALRERVRPLADVVEVDYTVPGCPPEPEVTAAALTTLLDPEQRPVRGSVLGTGGSTVCAECSRRREGKQLTGFRRTWQLDADPELCLLEQGLVCLGIATRQGCGARCPTVNMPCTGCYGAPEGVPDQGAAAVAALGAAIRVDRTTGGDEAAAVARADAVLDDVPDWVGTLYRYTLAGSALDAVGHSHGVTPPSAAPGWPQPAECAS